jgi:hypothetical protein
MHEQLVELLLVPDTGEELPAYRPDEANAAFPDEVLQLEDDLTFLTS